MRFISSRSRRRSSRRSSPRKNPTRCCRRWAARPRSTARWSSPVRARSKRYGVELIGANAEAIAKAEDRAAVPPGDGPDRPRLARKPARELAGRGAARFDEVGLPAIIRPSFTLGGTGGGIAYNREEFEEIVARRPARLADARGAGRGIGARLERIRDGGRARPRRQLHHRVLDRERRSDGRPYRRFGVRRARR